MSSIDFVKMQGIGNDYIYIDCFNKPVPADLCKLAKRLSDRHFGVGADGLILIHPSSTGHARMQMLNADGSEAQMCGNGIRCVAKYVYENILRETNLRLETASGMKLAEIISENDGNTQVRIDMGEPILSSTKIPCTLPTNNEHNQTSCIVEHPIRVLGTQIRVTCVSMGNPHCVIFTPRATDELVSQLGPHIEHSPWFPERTNIEFVEVKSPQRLIQRTWERGSGETLACGTGACAVCVAGVLAGRSSRRVEIQLLGGTLTCEWDETSNHVFMTGDAVEVFRGTVDSSL